MLGDLGKLIVAKGFKKLPKVQKIARSGHTANEARNKRLALVSSLLNLSTYQSVDNLIKLLRA